MTTDEFDPIEELFSEKMSLIEDLHDSLGRSISSDEALRARVVQVLTCVSELTGLIVAVQSARAGAP